MDFQEQNRQEHAKHVAEVHILCDSHPSLEIMREPFLSTVDLIHFMRIDPKFLRELEHRHG